MTKTAWHNNETLPQSMLNSGFKPLEQSDHFPSLYQAMLLSKGKTLLDIGCGMAEVFNTFPEWDYMGADLPHIIQNVSQKNNPIAGYIAFDADNTDFNFIEEYDLILMNSFLSEIPDWYTVLNKILINCKKDVIIHRQEVTDGETYSGLYHTYGNLPTTKNVVNYQSFNKTFELNGFSNIYDQPSFPYKSNWRTFLFRKESE